MVADIFSSDQTNEDEYQQKIKYFYHILGLFKTIQK